MTKKKSSKKKTHIMILEFDNKDAAQSFQAHWMDGGGDGGGNVDFYTKSPRDNKYAYLRIKGTGYGIEYVNGEQIIMTPENEAKVYEARRARLLGKAK